MSGGSRRRTLAGVAATIAIGVGAGAVAQQRDWNAVEVKSEKVADGIHLVTGMGGNIGAVTGPDGVLLIDDQYAPLTAKIQAEVAKLSDRPVRLVLNTHHHGDHVGGNANLAKAGAVIVAHQNVRRRLATTPVRTPPDTTLKPAPAAALPVVTFDRGLTMHWGAHELVVEHFPNAHTDGDAAVRFPAANVLHTGDLFFNGLYPRIDVAGGGSIDGMIAAADALLGKVDERTRIIPGHGPLGDRAALKEFRDMLAGVRDAVKPLVVAGKSRDETIAAKPTATWDAKWGGGFMKPDLFTGIVWDDLSRVVKK